LPAGYEAVLVDPDSPTAAAPMAQIVAGCVKPLPQILAAFRSGGGVPYEEYGDDLAEGQAGTTRPQFRHQLGQEWLPAMADVHARLLAEPPARVADIGMGLGWSSIAIATAYPKVRVDGFDLDEARWRRHGPTPPPPASPTGSPSRFATPATPTSPAATTSRSPSSASTTCRTPSPSSAQCGGCRHRGTVLIVDEKVADRFVAPGDDVERYMYGFSVLHCLPVGMIEQPSAATGTVIRESTMRRYAAEAGFAAVETLPIAHDFFRFYRMTG
jgi:hypothetical protein